MAIMILHNNNNNNNNDTCHLMYDCDVDDGALRSLKIQKITKK